MQDANAAPESATITASAAGAAWATTAITVNEDDTMTILADTSSLDVEEGSSATFSVSLSNQPSGSLVVSLASSDTTVATISPATLTFTSSNWSSGLPVTVTGIYDADTASESAAITATAPGALSRSVNVSVVDITPVCGDGACTGGETYYSCPQDCQDCSHGSCNCFCPQNCQVDILCGSP